MFMTFYYLTTNIMIPIIFLIMLLILLVYAKKISIKNQFKLFMWIEIAYAWSAVDVICAAIGVGFIEMK